LATRTPKREVAWSSRELLFSQPRQSTIGYIHAVLLKGLRQSKSAIRSSLQECIHKPRNNQMKLKTVLTLLLRYNTTSLISASHLFAKDFIEMHILRSSSHLALFTSSLVTHAAPIPASGSASSWFNEAIFTLIGAIIAVTGICITLVLSLPRLHQWLANPLQRELSDRPFPNVQILTHFRLYSPARTELVSLRSRRLVRVQGVEEAQRKLTCSMIFNYFLCCYSQQSIETPVDSSTYQGGAEFRLSTKIIFTEWRRVLILVAPVVG
jgi:hypothetical protein